MLSEKERKIKMSNDHSTHNNKPWDIHEANLVADNVIESAAEIGHDHLGCNNVPNFMILVGGKVVTAYFRNMLSAVDAQGNALNYTDDQIMEKLELFFDNIRSNVMVNIALSRGQITEAQAWGLATEMVMKKERH